MLAAVARRAWLIRSRLVPAILAQARAHGVDLRFELPADADKAREVEVSLDTLYAMTDAIAGALGDPDWGLHLAASAPRGSYGVLEFCCRTAPTVREAVRRLTRYTALVSRLETFTWRTRGRRELVERTVPGGCRREARHDNEFSLAYLVRVARELIGEPAWTPRRVWFGHPAPANRRAFATSFGAAKLEFGADTSGVEVDRGDLDRANASADPALFEVLEEQIERLALPPVRDLRAQLREAICLALRDGHPTLIRVARHLATSPRTLQRRIASQGTSFQALVDDTRAELATEYLRDPSRSLGEVAFLLGYSEPSAFVRAFRRWTGQTITTYRQSS
jgi:AraC-like DNA-binding protein